MDRHRESETTCRVCLSGAAQQFCTAGERLYWRCRRCAATFVDAAHLPDAHTERGEYLLHENDPQDARYRGFLNRLVGPLQEKLRPGMQGLDFGCGPGPALGYMLAEKSCTIHCYDPFFRPDASLLERTWDFIFCSEVVEHFHRPGREFARLDAMLKPDGWLGIMTCFQTEDERFERWHYRQDLTHVVFYRRETFEYIAGQFGWRCEIPADNVVLMQKRCK
ncbi:MAG: class I SAM-dependent methyltransferase [Phycisphaerae bacterium]|nr:class I SAM-dependent methyltransferase [Phycisphaerae bacterium]